MSFLRLHRPGYRIWKTVIAATLTLLVCSRFSQMSPDLALMGAYCAMERTIKASWHACLNQMVGVLVGSTMGFLLRLLLPQPPLWLIGLSLFAVIIVCNLLRVSYAVFLASLIFLSVCTGASTPGDILARIRDVSFGLSFGLLVNIFVHPYSNEKTVAALLRKLQRACLAALEQIVCFGKYPDLRPCEELREKLTYELEQTRGQGALLKRRRYREMLAWEEGCVQLGERMLQELQALATMDSFGQVSQENLSCLHALGMQQPDTPRAQAGGAETAVMNYHAACFYQAYSYLTELLPLGEGSKEAPALDEAAPEPAQPETEAEAATETTAKTEIKQESCK